MLLATLGIILNTYLLPAVEHSSFLLFSADKVFPRSRWLLALRNVELITESDMCSGCGVCMAMCPVSCIEMTMTTAGVFRPYVRTDKCNGCMRCLKSCPSADGLVEGLTLPNEDMLGDELFYNSASRKHSIVGRYDALYAGYAPSDRAASTSGGIATYLLCQLLEAGDVDRVICVQRSSKSETHFEYAICDTVDEVRSAAKTRYYPVHLGNVISQVLAEPGRYALVGLPCVIKAVRLASLQNKELSRRLVFLIGLFCGGMKSSLYTDFLGVLAGSKVDRILQPEYRIKQEDSGAGDSSFGCLDSEKGELLTLPIRRVGDVFGFGLFTPNACDYCDDVLAELADISLGDAWVAPYNRDGRGTNMVVVRSKKAYELIRAGILRDELVLNPVPVRALLKSQGPTIRHRKLGLSHRLLWAIQEGRRVPRRRVSPGHKWDKAASTVYRLKSNLRSKSTELWLHQGGNPDGWAFLGQMQPDFKRVRTAVRVMEVLRNPTRLPLGIARKIAKVMQKALFKQ